MRIGATFPQTEMGADPAAVRDFAQAVEGMGYDHILTYDHVLGANAASRPGWGGAYQHTDSFHEIFVLCGYLAAITERIELTTGIVILPQRQTALVAKQAAAIDILSGGRLRLGVGVGWNSVEYEALGEDFTNRGVRQEEQIELMRALWTKDLVTFEGRWHTVTDAGLSPPPVQRPIPVWFGGSSEATLRRIGRIGDGWIPMGDADEETRQQIERVHGYARDADRDPAGIGIEGGISAGEGNPDNWNRELKAWEELGGTHVTVNTMGAGLSAPDGHIGALRRFKEGVGF